MTEQQAVILGTAGRHPRVWEAWGSMPNGLDIFLGLLFLEERQQPKRLEEAEKRWPEWKGRIKTRRRFRCKAKVTSAASRTSK